MQIPHDTGDVKPLVNDGMNYQPQVVTLPETTIAPENGWLEDKFPFGMA